MMAMMKNNVATGYGKLDKDDDAFHWQDQDGGVFSLKRIMMF